MNCVKNEDCIEGTSFSKSFVRETIQEALTVFSDSGAYKIKLDKITNCLLERLEILLQMCESEAVVGIFLYEDMRNDYILLLIVKILSQDSIEQKEFITKLLKILQLICQNVEFGDKQFDVDYSFVVNILNLFLKVLFWREAEIMEISFGALYQISNVDVVRELIHNNLRENVEDYVNLIDLVLQNSLRENLLKNLWNFLVRVLSEASDLTKLYFPTLVKSFENTSSNISTYQLKNFTEIIITLDDSFKLSFLRKDIALMKNLKHAWEYTICNKADVSQDLLKTYEKFSTHFPFC